MIPPLGSARAGLVSQVGSAIPDSGLLHNYDPREITGLSNGNTVSTRQDQTSNDDDLTATGTPEYQSSVINGNPIVRYNGSDEYHQDTFTSSISPPYEIFHIFQARSVNKSETYFSGKSNSADWYVNQPNTTNVWDLFDGTNFGINAFTADTNPHLGVARFATNGEMQLEDNTPVGSVDLSNTTLGGFTIAAEDGGANPATIDSGQLLIYDPSVSGYSRSDVVTYLISEWGPF